MNWIWKHRGAIGMIVFVLCILAAFRINTNARLALAKSAQLQACNRGNALRAELNQRGDVIRNFFLDAANTRTKQGIIAKKNGADAEAKVNFQAAANYNKSANAYERLAYIDCPKSYAAGGTVYTKRVTVLPARTESNK